MWSSNLHAVCYCGAVQLLLIMAAAAAAACAVCPVPSKVTGHCRLLETNATLKRLIEMRNPYIDPINILQVRVL